MYNKDADNIFFLLSFTRCQREKNIERTFLVSAGAGEKLVLGLLSYIIYQSKK